MTMPVDEELLAAVRRRGIQRLTHFTPSRNLPHILRAGAILSTAQLQEAGATFINTDPVRADHHPGHICCNIEYPNMYYFDQANRRGTAINYADWVVFLLAPEVAATPGTLFAPRNAAKYSGAEIAPGVEGLARLYASRVGDRDRADRHNPASPTDVQAEVLVPGLISLSAVQGIVVPDPETLARETGRLSLLNRDFSGLNWYSSRGIFEKWTVMRAVRQSESIAVESAWETVAREQS